MLLSECRLRFTQQEGHKNNEYLAQALINGSLEAVISCLNAGADIYDSQLASIEKPSSEDASNVVNSLSIDVSIAEIFGFLSIRGPILEALIEHGKKEPQRFHQFILTALKSAMIVFKEDIPSRSIIPYLYAPQAKREEAIETYLDLALHHLEQNSLEGEALLPSPDLRWFYRYFDTKRSAEKLLKHPHAKLTPEEGLGFFKAIVQQPVGYTPSHHSWGALLPLVLRKLGGDLNMPELMAVLSSQTYIPLIRELAKPIFSHAIAAGQTQFVRQQLTSIEGILRINECGPWNEPPPLLNALKYRQFDLAQELLHEGAHFNVLVPHPDFKDPLPFFAWCVMDLQPEALRWSLQHITEYSSDFLETLSDSYRLKAGFNRSISPLSKAALSGNEDMVKMLLQFGVEPSLSSGELNRIAEPYPKIRALFQEPKLMEGVHHQLTVLKKKWTPKKKISLFQGKDHHPVSSVKQTRITKTPHLNGQQAVVPLKSPLDVHHVDTLDIPMPHPHQIQWGMMNSLTASLRLSGPLKELQEQSIEMAKQLNALNGSHPLLLSIEDQAQLKRLWEVSIPLLLKHALSVPEEGRPLRFEGHVSVFDKLEQAYKTSIKVMTTMKHNSIIQSHRKMDVEMAVIQDHEYQAEKRLVESSSLPSEDVSSRSSGPRF